ncbi:MAG: HEAT repeat domain-containing protein [Myxococcota bacterium]|nr:HEAT repeat domain-containing protein [Myxococcota bacterium]
MRSRGLRRAAGSTRMSFRAAIGLLGTSLLVTSAASVAGAQAPSSEQLRLWLSGFERMPDASAWRAMGPETVHVLRRAYEDPAEAPWVRLRAVAAAGYFRTEDSRAFLRAVARDPAQPELVVREALLALARAFGAAAVADIGPFLEHPSTLVREAVAIALGRIGDERARGAARRRIGAEPDPTVREALERVARSPARRR